MKNMNNKGKINVADIRLGYYESMADTSAYDIWFDKVEPKNEIFEKKGKELDELTFDEVAYLKKYYSTFEAEHLQILIDIFFREVLSVKIFGITLWRKKIEVKELWIFEIIQWYKYLHKMLEKILIYESNIINEYDADLIQAGVDRMERFSEMNTKIPIAEQFCCTPKDVGNWLYVDVIIIAQYNSIKADINRRYSQIIARKRK